MMQEPRASLEDARRTVSLLMRPGDVFELRALSRVRGQQHVDAGYFDDAEQLARAAVARSGDADGVYMTINPVMPALLARKAKNRVHRVGSGETTSDRDVRQRRALLIDVDPIRPSGISASDVEHEAAIALADRIRSELAARGWAPPLFADSGNGAHLLYAIDLPVDDQGLVRRVLEQLSKLFSSSELKIDEKVFNPARISKIYGTLAKKGDDTPERPHRIARIIDTPPALSPTDRSCLEAFAPNAQATRLLKRKVDGYVAERSAFSIDDWLTQHVSSAQERTWSEGRRWILAVCPFNESHDRGEAYVCQLHSGAIAAGCQHESCRWGWRDLRERFEPDAYRKRSSPPPESIAPEVLYQDERYIAELEAFAARDREPAVSEVPQIPWRRLPEIAGEIWARKDEPWIGLNLGSDEIGHVRAGGIIVVMGGSGSGKSSLVSNFLLQHAKNVGPAIALSIELPADELAARIAGIRCDASWEEALTGGVRLEHLEDALALPRMYVLDRDHATLQNLERCVDAARVAFPNEPILIAIDYAQLMESHEREIRLRVADAFKQIDRLARSKRVAAIAVSQMGRAGAQSAVSGEKIGVETASLGAESAAIERFATMTIAIGQRGEARDDGSEPVDVSIGKGRMSGGDRVIPMAYWGRTGLWRVTGEARKASAVRAERDVEKESKALRALEHQLIGAAQKAQAPLSREQLMELVSGRKEKKRNAIAALIASGDLVEVARRAPRSRAWTIWTPDRAVDAGIQLVRDLNHDGND
jgi:hypothetical protein